MSDMPKRQCSITNFSFNPIIGIQDVIVLRLPHDMTPRPWRDNHDIGRVFFDDHWRARRRRWKAIALCVNAHAEQEHCTNEGDEQNDFYGHFDSFSLLQGSVADPDCVAYPCICFWAPLLALRAAARGRQAETSFVFAVILIVMMVARSFTVIIMLAKRQPAEMMMPIAIMVFAAFVLLQRLSESD
jgi:hypothetical protein